MLIIHAKYKIKNGKSASRWLRIQDKFPGIIYGKNHSALAIELDHNIVFNLQKKIDFYKDNLCLIIEKREFLVKVQAIQRHAFKLRLLHIDFMHA